MILFFDANVLIALFSEAHIHHEAALARFLAHRRRDWATCLIELLLRASRCRPLGWWDNGRSV
jgi:predicted nucleic acid-binding protein